MNPTARFVLRRLAVTVPVLLVMSITTFLLLHLVPGDPVRSMLGLHATETNVGATRRQLGLDRPLLAQYWTWLTDLFRGNLGVDLTSHVPVTTLIGSALPVTLELTLGAVLVGVVLGIALGLASAAGPRLLRRSAETFSIAGIAIPYFWLGIVLALVFGGYLHLLPPSGYTSFTGDPVSNIEYMVLPVLTLAVGEAAYLSRLTRGIATDLLRGPSVRFLEAKGLGRASIIFKHVARQGSGPIVTIVGIEIGVLLGGSIIVETIFSLPGIGRLLVTAIQQRDYTVVQGCVLTISTLFILTTLLADLCVGLLDPRMHPATRS